MVCSDLDIFYTMRKRLGLSFKGVVVETPNLLSEETVILLELYLTIIDFYQVNINF